MSYTNVYPTRINWENDPSINTPINETNLNKMDYALYQHDQTLATWDTTKANQSDLLLSVKSIDYDTETGVFVFTWQNGTTKTVDLNIEKIPVSFSMSPQGIITMTTADGTQYTADVGALIKIYTFTDSTEIDFTVTTDQSGNKTVTAALKDGSIAGTKLQPNYLADCTAAKTAAETAQGLAEDSAEDAEAWAVGQRNGQDVPSTDPAYHNNSKYWAEQANPTALSNMSDVALGTLSDGDVLEYDSATQKWTNSAPAGGALSTLTDVTIGVLADGQILAYDNNASKWKNIADPNTAKIGTLANLTTTVKTDLVSAINEVDSDVSGKADTADVNNKHKVTSKQVTTSSWTQDTTSQSGSTLYKKQISLSHVYANPSVDIGAASGSVLPTTAEQEAYDLLEYVTINDTTLTLYASAIPSTSFYINIEGVD